MVKPNKIIKLFSHITFVNYSSILPQIIYSYGKILDDATGFNFYIKEKVYGQKLAVLNRHIIKLSMIIFLCCCNFCLLHLLLTFAMLWLHVFNDTSHINYIAIARYVYCSYSFHHQWWFSLYDFAKCCDCRCTFGCLKSLVKEISD